MTPAPLKCDGGAEHDFSKEVPTIVDGEIVGTDYVCARCGLSVEEITRREAEAGKR